MKKLLLFPVVVALSGTAFASNVVYFDHAVLAEKSVLYHKFEKELLQAQNDYSNSLMQKKKDLQSQASMTSALDQEDAERSLKRFVEDRQVEFKKFSEEKNKEFATLLEKAKEDYLNKHNATVQSSEEEYSSIAPMMQGVTVAQKYNKTDDIVRAFDALAENCKANNETKSKIEQAMFLAKSDAPKNSNVTNAETILAEKERVVDASELNSLIKKQSQTITA